MDDIVERLRSPEVLFTDGMLISPVACVAATEIERLREALQQGVAMRAAQKAYFADRSRENLIASKEAERAFDVAARTALGEDK